MLDKHPNGDTRNTGPKPESHALSPRDHEVIQPLAEGKSDLELVQVQVQGLCPFVQSRERRHSAPTLYAGDVRTQEAGAPLNVSVRKSFRLAEFTEPSADVPGELLPEFGSNIILKIVHTRIGLRVYNEAYGS